MALRVSHATPSLDVELTRDRMAAIGRPLKHDELPHPDGKTSHAEVAPVLTGLIQGGLNVTAVHNHLQSENPPVYFIHFWADGAPGDVLAGIKAALDAGKAP